MDHYRKSGKTNSLEELNTFLLSDGRRKTSQSEQLNTLLADAIACFFLFWRQCNFPISCLNNNCNQLQGDICITKLLEWSNLWELHFNEKKCHVMHFHFLKEFEYNYYLNNHVLTVGTTHKDLGIVFSANLMWGPHFKNRYIV